MKTRQDHLASQIADVRIGPHVIVYVFVISDEHDLVLANCNRLRDAPIRVDRVDEGVRKNEVGWLYGGPAST